MGIQFLLLLASITAADDGKPVLNPSAAEFARLNGTWFMQKSVKNGESLNVGNRGYMLRATTADQRVLLIMHHRTLVTTIAGDLEFHPSTSPRQFDFKIAWDEIGSTKIAGIYELDEDDLRVCFGLLGKERPTTLEAPPGSDLYVLHFEKHATTKEAALRRFTKQSKSELPERRVEALSYLAEMKLEDGNLPEARQFAEELAKAPPQAQDIGLPGSATHQAHILLGLIYIRENRLDDAARNLQSAVRAPISRRMRLRGPDLRLAKGLLDQGRHPPVIEYLEWCKTFWPENDGKLDRWITELKAGRAPADLDPRENADLPLKLEMEELQQIFDSLQKK